MPIAVATALIRGLDPLPELAVSAVSLALERARLAHPHSVVLFLSSEFVHSAHGALAAASRAANCLNVWGCTAPGLLTEQDASIDEPAACAMVIGEGLALGPPGAGDAARLSLAVPSAATPIWLSGPGGRFGLISTDAGAQQPGRVWAHGANQAEGRASASFNGARTMVGVARGIRALSEAQSIDAVDGYDLLRLNNQFAYNSLLRALPPDLREAERLPLNQLFAGEVTESGDDAIARGRYRVLPLISVNHDDRSVTLGQRLKPGSRLFWGMRSTIGAEEDMRRMVDLLALDGGGATPDLGVMFSCMGRGPYFYGGEDRDLAIVRSRYPGMPLIGAYGAGQIAPLYEGNALIQNSALLALVSAK
ncbi:MAG: FIST C-terminal domain-containing protein [Sterolibacteriaceae bacterium]|nr:FIST C-terminal domain-containing protein [Candidatus Methylophosphatis haderslevensis]